MSSLVAHTDFQAWTGRLLRHVRRRSHDMTVNVLTYHSISSQDTEFTRGTTLRHSPAEFERHLDYLAAHYRPISLRELVTRLEEGETPRRAVVITIDDGYADALSQAAPILARRRIPVTIFPVASVIGNADLMWQHKLAWLRWHGHAERVAAALKAAGLDGSSAVSLADIEEFVRSHYRADVPEILESVLNDLGHSGRELAGRIRPYVDAEDVAGADPELVEFGNHTLTHPVLAALDEAAQRREIVAARQVIESITGRPPLALAYPFGLNRHYDAASKRIAAETGHRAALDARRRINHGRIDPMELSRKVAPVDDPVVFEKLIEDWPPNTPLLTGRGRA